jgi:hypothetical protein
MKPQSSVTELRQLIKDARWAIWAFFIINVFVLILFLVDGILNEFVFMALLIQALLFLGWLLPVFCYQVFFKQKSAKYAFYKAMASYKDALGHLSW